MYAELVCRSNFSFLRGASHPEELVAQAAKLGLSALALADQDGFYGMVKAHLMAKELGVKLIVASHLTLTDGPELVAYAQNAEGYANLSQILSQSRLRHPKGQAGLPWREVAERSEGLMVMLPFPAPLGQVQRLAEAFPGRFYVGLCRALSAGDEARSRTARALAAELGVPLCAHNDVHTHARARQPLQDVLTSARYQVPLAELGVRLFPNAERTLKGPEEMLRLFADEPELIGRTMEIADACHFTLDELRYEFPPEELPEGVTPDAHLRTLTFQGIHERYPEGVPEAVTTQLEHELTLIARLEFAGYFLTIYDIVRFARSRGILCQGRGSAANSAVCFALHVTSIDPVRMGLLFERFVSQERPEPPDIDVDFEHERREEVIQYVYQKHGRHRAGMVCEVICYRGRLAVREVGKALGLSLDQVDKLAKSTETYGGVLSAERVTETGISASDPTVAKLLLLSEALQGFPRHLSIHVGGFVITQDALTKVVPIENASMKDRTVVQWEKDDLNAINILKVDLLGLGMLTVLSKTFALIQKHEGRTFTLATIPKEHPAVYAMLCEADAIGVFQVESRAQMTMLPRLKPKSFYDLVIEVAIIRPGPIVGDMVHPFLRRREGREEVIYPSEETRAVLERTLGVPLFQEQAMRLAMVAAGFTPAEADGLRRALTHKRAEVMLATYRQRFVLGCLKRGYTQDFAERCFAQFKGFSHYGFPESHAASFALLCYASAYLKCFHPAAFTCGLLNAQPMGFYAPHTLVEDAKRHGVRVLPVDVQRSEWDCTLEEGALRLGFRMIRGLPEKSARTLAQARTHAPEGRFENLMELARRTRLWRHELVRLAAAGALDPLCGGRREALWAIQALGPIDEEDLFFGLPLDDSPPDLPALTLPERVNGDYRTVGLSLESHPVALFRTLLDQRRALTAERILSGKAGRRVGVGGLIICRQRPPTAKGICFISLEDESGITNLVVMPEVFTTYRRTLLGSAFVYAEGQLERSGKVVNVRVDRVESLSLAPAQAQRFATAPEL